MDMTQVFIAMLVSLPSTIAAIAAAIVSIRTSTKIDTTSKKVDENTEITQAAKDEAKLAAVNVAVEAVNVAKDVANTTSKKVVETMETVKKTINGRMDELIAAAAAKAFAEGMKEGEALANQVEIYIKTSQERLDRLSLHHQRNFEAIAVLQAQLEQVKKEHEDAAKESK